MENAETILVIILSSFLAVFLLLAIVLLIKAIQIVNQLKKIADRAESIADKAEAATELLSKAKGPIALGRLIARVAESVLNKDKPRGNKRRRNEEDEDA